MLLSCDHSPVDDVPHFAESLFSVPAADFIDERKRLARDLREEGRKEDAAVVVALRKPAPVVLAANRAARSRPKVARAAAAAAARMTKRVGDADVQRALDDQLALLEEVALAFRAKRHDVGCTISFGTPSLTRMLARPWLVACSPTSPSSRASPPPPGCRRRRRRGQAPRQRERPPGEHRRPGGPALVRRRRVSAHGLRFAKRSTPLKSVSTLRKRPRRQLSRNELALRRRSQRPSAHLQRGPRSSFPACRRGQRIPSELRRAQRPPGASGREARVVCARRR